MYVISRNCLAFFTSLGYVYVGKDINMIKYLFLWLNHTFIFKLKKVRLRVKNLTKERVALRLSA